MTKFYLLFCLAILPSCLFSQESNAEVSIEHNAGNDEIFLVTKTDIKESGKIILQWSCAALKENQFFTVERSPNGVSFEVIGGIKGKKGQGFFEFTDERPAGTNNFYRIKSVVSENKVVFSKIISKGVAGARFSSFYPNPVEKLLIVRTESPVEIKIVDPFNKVRISKQLEVGLQLVDVSGLEKGLYFISLFQKESNRIITDKLVKQ